MGYKPWDSWESEYLVFEEDDHYEGKTKRLVVVSKRHLTILGEIKWYGPWRQYVFFPEEATIWNRGCMEDVNAVLKALMEEWQDGRVSTARMDRLMSKPKDMASSLSWWYELKLCLLCKKVWTEASYCEACWCKGGD